MTLSTDQVRQFFERPFYLERGRFLIGIRAAIVRELLGSTAHARILDLGCGDGSISIPLLTEATELTLLDLSPRMLTLAAASVPAAQRAKVRTVNEPLDAFEPGLPYDVVLCVGVLAHVPSIDGALAKIAQCVRPGGTVVVEFTPNPNPIARFLFPYYWMRRKIWKNPMPYETNKIPLSALLTAARRHGLELEKLKRHFFPIPTMAWWPQRWLHRYAMFAKESSLISRIGTEHILRFSRR